MTTASQTPATPTAVRAAEGIIRAAMERGAATPHELARAEHAAGILFDAQAAADIAAAAAEQAHAEDQAEIAERGRQLAAMAGDHRSITAVRRLLEGRPGTDLLTVAEIAAAAEYGSTPFDSAPMTLTWTGQTTTPLPPHLDGQHAYIHCTTAHAGRAVLKLTREQRQGLAVDLGLQTRDAIAPCATEGCGTVDDYDASDPALSGWVRVEVAGVEDDRPRWYCSPMCVSDALARARAELAADDRAAAVDPDQQAPELRSCCAGPVCTCTPSSPQDDEYIQPVHAPAEDDVARCARCSCTDTAACEGGCAWVPNDQGIDLCSACATPAELAAAGWAVSGE